jgi:hypothetical protein
LKPAPASRLRGALPIFDKAPNANRVPSFPFDVRSGHTMRPNPSLEPIRYGRQRKPGVRRLRHLRTPGLRCLPPRSGLTRTLGSHGSGVCASQYASPRRLGLKTCPFTRRALLGSTVQRALRPGPSLALLGSRRFAEHVHCYQSGGAARAPGAMATHGPLSATWFAAPGALHPNCKPNPSPKLTRYGKRCKPGPRHLVHHRAPGLQRLPPQAACLER